MHKLYFKLCRHYLDLIFLCLFVLCILIMLSTNEFSSATDYFCELSEAICFRSKYAELFNKIWYDLSVGGAISLIFYALLVRIPSIQRRKQIKRSFYMRFQNFKIASIKVFLLLSDGSYDANLPEQLFDQKKFRKYFKEEVGVGLDRWHVLFNKLSENEHYLKELLCHLDVFREEVSFVLYNCNIEDDKVFDFLKNLSEVIYLNKVVDLEYENLKALLGFYWQLFAGWSVVYGYTDDDIINDMINSL